MSQIHLLWKSQKMGGIPVGHQKLILLHLLEFALLLANTVLKTFQSFSYLSKFSSSEEGFILTFFFLWQFDIIILTITNICIFKSSFNSYYLWLSFYFLLSCFVFLVQMYVDLELQTAIKVWKFKFKQIYLTFIKSWIMFEMILR